MYTMLYKYCGLLNAWINNVHTLLHMLLWNAPQYMYNNVYTMLFMYCGMLNAWITMCTQCYTCIVELLNAWNEHVVHIVIHGLWIAQYLNNIVYTMLFMYCGLHNAWITMCTQCYTCIVGCSTWITIVYNLCHVLWNALLE